MIRPVQSKDNISLSKIIKTTFEEHDAPKQGTVYSDPTTDNLYQLFNETKKSILWVAEEEGKIQGCCGIYPTQGLREGIAELVKFYLDKSCRGKGIGKELLQKCFDSAKTLGYTHLYLESLPQFSKAVRMYEKLGFTMLTQPLGNSGHTTCTIWMLKSLE